MSNVYNFLTNVLCGLMIDAQSKVLQAQSQTLKKWTSTNQQLTSNQVSNPVAILNAAGNHYDYAPGDTADQKAIVDGMNVVLKVALAKPNSDESAEAMSTFISTYCTSSAAHQYLYAMSQTLGVVLLSLLQKTFSTSAGSSSSAQLSTLNAFNQLCSSVAQQNEQPGSVAAKTESSQIQTSIGNLGNLNEMASASSAVVGNIAGLLQQSY